LIPIEGKKMKKKVCAGCGTVLVAVDSKGNPACPICIGISEHSGMVREVEIPDEVLKKAVCPHCKRTADQTRWNIKDLPFYEAKNNTFYCGCRGWD